MAGQQLTATQEWKSHGPMVIAAMIGMSFYSVVTYSLGVFIEPLEREFGWTRAQISMGLTIFAGITTLGSPFIGMLIDRVGTRKIAVPGMALTAAAMAAFSLASGTLVQWFGLWVVFGLVSLTVKSSIWSTGVSSVFTASRGLALAVALSGTAIGQGLSPILANMFIEDYGWRDAYRWLGFGWGGVSFVLLLLFFFDIRDSRRKNPAGPADTPSPVSGALPGLTFRQAMRDQRIIRIGLVNLLFPFVGAAITVHLVPIITETGTSRTTAVEVAALAGIGGLAGKFITGWLLDKVQGNLVPFLSYSLAAIGYLLFLDVLNSTAALFAGSLVIGYASGAGFQVTTYLVSRYAGMRAFGTVFGIIASLMMVGTALGPTLAGHVHDVTGSYTMLLAVAIPIVVFGSFLLVGLGPYPEFQDSGEPSPDTA